MQKLRLTLAGILAGVALLVGTGAQAQSLAQAKRQIEAENWNAARKTLSALMSKDAKDARPYYYMGQLLMLSSTLDSANAMFNRGISVSEKEPLNYLGLAKVQFQRNKPTEAEANIEKALSLSRRKNANVLMIAGETYLEAPNVHADKAINLLNEAIKLAPNEPELYVLLGDAYFAKNQGGPAVSNYERALQLNPKQAQAHMKIGKIFALSRNYTQALSALEKALVIDTTFAPTYRELGELYYQSNQLDNARKAYKNYVRLANNDIGARGRYAGFLYLSKDYKSAIAYADEVLKHDPNNYIMLRVKGYSQYEAGEYENAKQTLDKYFTVVPADKLLASDYENYGNILAKQNKLEEAVMNLNKALAMDTARVSVHSSLADLYQKNKEYGKAAKHFRKRIEAGEAITLQDYFALGQALYLDKQYLAADSAFSKITELQPDLTVGHQWRARAMSGLDPESTKGLAKPHYEMVVAKGVADPVKNKAALIEAYDYLGYYNVVKKDMPKAKTYYLEMKKLDPGNAKANEALKAL